MFRLFEDVESWNFPFKNLALGDGETAHELTVSGMITLFAAFFFLLVGTYPYLGFFFTGDLPVNSKLPFKDSIAVVLWNCSFSSL